MFYIFPGGTQLCDPKGDVRFCWDGNATGKTIYITSGAPKWANASCVCDIKANVQSNTISVSYMLLQKHKNCGIKVVISNFDQEFSCNETEVNLPSNVTHLYFYKTATQAADQISTGSETHIADQISSGMCLRIRIGM